MISRTAFRVDIDIDMDIDIDVDIDADHDLINRNTVQRNSNMSRRLLTTSSLR